MGGEVEGRNEWYVFLTIFLFLRSWVDYFTKLFSWKWKMNILLFETVIRKTYSEFWNYVFDTNNSDCMISISIVGTLIEAQSLISYSSPS